VSPSRAMAAASMDMFTNYPERGRLFSEAVNRLP
jgi:UDP-N-acetylmuramoylalanine--D-glutamate ligase